MTETEDSKRKKSKNGRKKRSNAKLNVSESDENNKLSDGLEKTFTISPKRKSLTSKANAIVAITNAKTGGNKWQHYTKTRRLVSLDGDKVDRRKTGGQGLVIDLQQDENRSEDAVDGKMRTSEIKYRKGQNRLLIEHFAQASKHPHQNDAVDFDFIEKLLQNGADINCADKYGQTVLHEVARVWHIDVAKFLLENGADIDRGDNYGRTPLHISAAVDYTEMVNFLIMEGANKESLTKGELQTPTHFAARTDSVNSLKALINHGCEYKQKRDYKGRTPLHVAAELDRSETARMLIELDDPAPAGVIDDSGQSAVVLMITKMPPVAKLALDQFHTTDRANRRQFYHLNHLEPKKAGDQLKGHPQTALRVLVAFNQIDLITHRSVERLLEIKWRNFGKKGGLWQIVKAVIFIGIWTAIGLSKDHETRHEYNLKSEWWRIILWILAVAMTLWQVIEEIKEYRSSRKAHLKWKNWREEEVRKDLQFCHPRWPEETAYLNSEIDRLNGINDSEVKTVPEETSSVKTFCYSFVALFRASYFNDPWNIFDWICYVLLTVASITHVVDVIDHTNAISRWHIRIMAIAIILIWIRILKIARAYSVGPFVVMIFKMLTDIFKFVFVYLVFFCPYVFAFWMIFGASKRPEKNINEIHLNRTKSSVSGMKTFDMLIFTLFRITLVDDYDFDGMIGIDKFMTFLLLGSWLALSAIIMLNLIIALMSDTFQRVYDNARANAAMQKAITILNIEEGLTKKKREKFREYIHNYCSPEERFYDDDDIDDGKESLQKVTIQIRQRLDSILDYLNPEMSSYSVNQLTDKNQAVVVIQVLFYKKIER
ncbi:DgyrCDS11796 [Dimorphilus gyrociliatus]|uniref:DgyrCDS11796 n=1 Tax=Dimorphilus gyrociliatus TaxID=2664684 RepID=A0A7I8W6D4_9ANNE|nr:DgyrCDS11796 [Dimorphilus gyrociliatus]